MRKEFAFILIAALLAGCDYTVPLVETPSRTINENAVGLWQQTHGKGAGQQLLILPMSRHEYLIAFPSGKDNTMYARAAQWEGRGIGLLQINWFGTAEGDTPDNKRTYQYADYDLDENQLTLRLVNPRLIDKQLSDSGVLARTIEKERNNPDLYRKAIHFSRISD